MTDEQILELATYYFYHTKDASGEEWSTESTNGILEFARVIQNKTLGRVIDLVESEVGK